MSTLFTSFFFLRQENNHCTVQESDARQDASNPPNSGGGVWSRLRSPTSPQSASNHSPVPTDNDSTRPPHHAVDDHNDTTTTTQAELAKTSCTTFDDPLGLGLFTLPTMDHADKMTRDGQKHVKVGTALHSRRIVSYFLVFITTTTAET